jgi:thiamine-phosphate diphosphorylase / hydroxyethylthiazole kinase
MASFDKHAVDYSLYLVTDSQLLAKTARSFEDHVYLLIEGGVTVVQLREKSLSTSEFIKRARNLLEITRPRNIPLIINDRIDVALGIGADGVHIGVDDMDLATARRLMGDRKIVGVSVNTEEEAIAAFQGGADYVGTVHRFRWL